MSVTVKLHGVREAIADIERLGGKIRATHNRNAVSAAAGVLRRAAEGNMPQESGTLKRNVRVRVGRSKKSGDWYGVVGARRKAKVAGVRQGVKQAVGYNAAGRAVRVTARQAARRTGRVDYRVPARYLHLVERGSKPHQVQARTKRTMVTAGGDFIGRVATTHATSQMPMQRAVRTSGRTASGAAIRQLQKAIKQEAKHG